MLQPETIAFFQRHTPYFEDGVLAGSAEDRGALERELYAIEEIKEIKRADLDKEGIKYLWVDDVFRAAVRRATARIILPESNTAQNSETYLMNACWWFKTVDCLGPKASQYAVDQLISGWLQSGLDVWLDINPSVQSFASAWHKSGFARLDVGHKLAAALMFTDPRDVVVHCPWNAVSIQIPEGLCEPFRRIWVCADKQNKPHLISVLAANGVGTATSPELRILQEMNDTRAELLTNFMNGALLAVTEPASLRSGMHGKSSKTKRPRLGAPVEGELYILGSPIDIDDFRGEVKAVWSGEKRQGPKVQFVVRGHWREQPYGPQSSQRKRIWLKPFWKGPKATRVLLRKHVVGKE